jgi:hypothetical protein
MTNKTFSVKRDNRPGIHVTGFPADGHQAFINIKFGDTGQNGEFQVLLYMADACAFLIALENAINHAEPRAVEAADLGLMDEAA